MEEKIFTNPVRSISAHSADGNSLDDDDMHWIVSCPVCEREIEFKGYFDCDDINKCPCGTEFKTRRVYFENGSYME